METPRVCVTGIGVVSPVGCGVDRFWGSLVSGASGVGAITLFDADRLPVRIGGEVRDLPLSEYVPSERSRKMPRAAKLAVVAAHLALADSGLAPDEDQREGIDLYLGVSCPDIRTYTRVIAHRVRKGREHVDPSVVTKGALNAPTGYVAIELGLRGETPTFCTGCASSTDAIGHALRHIRAGCGQVVLAGGADAAVQEYLIAAFARSNALSTRNERPEAASRPFEADRDGHVLSEAAAILVLEEMNHARRRRAKVYAEVRGYAANSDSHSLTDVHQDATRASRCVTRALEDARVEYDEVDYHCAHGSASREADRRETRMLKGALGEHARRTHVSSIKSMVGHPLGASGALQAATCALAIHRGVVPPTINYDERDPECDLDYVPNEAREAVVRNALSYAQGMGGSNAALVMSAC